MSHPKDKRERFLIGMYHGIRRAYGYWATASFTTKAERKEFLEKNAQIRRDTTKLCSCNLCGNPRKVAWSAKDMLTMSERKFRESCRLEQI